MEPFLAGKPSTLPLIFDRSFSPLPQNTLVKFFGGRFTLLPPLAPRTFPTAALNPTSAAFFFDCLAAGNVLPLPPVDRGWITAPHPTTLFLF